MKKRVIGMVCAALAAAGYGVVTNESMVITSPTVWSGVTNVYTAPVNVGSILADFTLQGRSYVRFMGANQTGVGTPSVDTNPQFYIATNANDVTVTVKGYSLFATTYRNSDGPAKWTALGIDPPGDRAAAPSRVRVRLGTAGGEPGSTGRAKLVVEDYTKDTGFGVNVFGTFWAEWLFVESSVATNAPGMIDFLEIKSGAYADIACIYNKSPYPARILFNGGVLFRNNVCDHGTSLSPETGHEIICQGVNGNPISLRKQFAEAKMSGQLGGTVRMRGTDVRLHNEGAVPQWLGGWNFRPWRLMRSDNIVWEITGDIHLTGNMWLRTESDDVLPYGPGVGGMVVEYNGYAGYAEGNANQNQHHCCLDLYGRRQHLNSVTSTGTGSNIGIVTNTASATGTLVLGAQDVNATLNARCTANVAVEKEGAGTLSVRESSAESLAVNGGRVFFSGAPSAFTNIAVAAGVPIYGKVDVRGCLTFAGTDAAIDQGGFEPVLGSEAVLDLGSDGRTLTVKTLSVGGAYLAPGVYAAADNAWLPYGSVKVLLSPSVAPTDVTWTGATSTSASAAGNWDVAPDFSTATCRPIFASPTAATASAVLDTGATCNVLGLGFGGVSAFTLSGNDTLQLYGNVSVDDPGLGAMPRYEVAAPVLLRDSQTITMPADGAEVVFSGGIDGDPTCGIELKGTKLSGLAWDYSTNGVLKLVNPRVSGPITHTTGGGKLVLKGQVGNPGDVEPLTIRYGDYRNNSNINDGWCETGVTRFEGVTCWKPVSLEGRGQMAGATGVTTFFIAAANTTNVFKEIVTQTPSTALSGEGVSATVVFEKGYRDTMTIGAGFSAHNATYVFEGPMVQVRKDREVSGSNAKHVFKATGNRAAMVYRLSSGLVAEFHVDDAFDDTLLHMNAGNSALRLNGTHQRWRLVYSANNAGTIEGDGCLEIMQGVLNEAATASTNLTSVLSGRVSIEMTGPGWQRLRSRAFASYGDITVSDGTLTFTDGASWLNGTNVNVKGTGTLKLTSANTFNPQHAVIRFADSGKIEVPAGMTQKFAEGWIGDRRLSGIYTAANLPAHISGSGAIQVKGVGFQIIFR